MIYALVGLVVIFVLLGYVCFVDYIDNRIEKRKNW